MAFGVSGDVLEQDNNLCWPADLTLNLFGKALWVGLGAFGGSLGSNLEASRGKSIYQMIHCYVPWCCDFESECIPLVWAMLWSVNQGFCSCAGLEIVAISMVS